MSILSRMKGMWSGLVSMLKESVEPNYEVVRGAHVLPGRLRGNGYVHNETFDVGINRAKRAIKAIKDKRERRAARTRFIQRLRSSGIKS